MARPDVTVIGAGIFGLSIGWAMVRRGARVLVLDHAGIGAGASGGVVGALAPHVPEQWNEKKAFQLESLLMAEDWWAGVTAASGLSAGYARSGRLQALADLREVDSAKARAEGARHLWGGRAVWQVMPAPPDWAPRSASGLVVRDTLSARIAPRAALAALAGAIRAGGGDVRTGSFDGASGPVVWATGAAGLRELSDDLGQDAGGAEKGQAALLAFDARDRPQLFADGVHIVPHADGTVAVGSTSERTWSDPAATDGALDQIIARAVAACPALDGAPVIARWAGLRPRSRSRAPVLGAWPGRSGQFVANGGFKIGFGMAPKVAEVMADLVLDGQDAIPDALRLQARQAS